MPGVWSPGQIPTVKQLSPERTKEVQKDEAILPVWTPANAGGASPAAERKEFRPVSFESPILSRKKQPKEQVHYQLHQTNKYLICRIKILFLIKKKKN